jgi:hypothetical protein
MFLTYKITLLWNILIKNREGIDFDLNFIPETTIVYRVDGSAKQWKHPHPCDCKYSSV